MKIVDKDGGEINAAQAVDLTHPPCDACTYCAKLGQAKVCVLNPPVFTLPLPQTDAKGSVLGMTPGGWTFPPAAHRCGQFKERS